MPYALVGFFQQLSSPNLDGMVTSSVRLSRPEAVMSRPYGKESRLVGRQGDGGLEACTTSHRCHTAGIPTTFRAAENTGGSASAGLSRASLRGTLKRPKW